MSEDDRRPPSGLRGRATRGGRGAKASASEPAADSAAANEDGDEGAGDEGNGVTAAWKVELESIMQGTHAMLVEALEPHDTKMKALVSQADRIKQLQIANIDALFECEKKMAEDEHKAQLEFFKQRLIDSIEEKQKKAAQQSGRRSGGADATGKAAGADGKGGNGNGKRKREDGSASSASPILAAYVLKPDELKADLEEISTNVDHYSVRSAAMGSEDPRGGAADAYFDRSRQLLHCSNQSFERGASLYVFSQGQRLDDTWTLTAMNAVEVTLRDSESNKLKVTVAQLRNGRYVFRPAPGY